LIVRFRTNAEDGQEQCSPRALHTHAIPI